MLTTEKLRNSAADLLRNERAIELQLQVMRGARMALEQLVNDSDKDDVDRKAAEAEAEEAAVRASLDDGGFCGPRDVFDEVAAALDDGGPYTIPALCTDPDCDLCKQNGLRGPIETLAGPAGRLDPGEVAVALKD